MKLLQRQWTAKDGWRILSNSLGENHNCVQLVLLFGQSNLLQGKELYKSLYEEFPNAIVVGCSTAGEICGNVLQDDSVVCTAVYFEHSTVKESHVFLDRYPDADIPEVVTEMVESLYSKDLVHLFVLADGVKVYGADIIEGLRASVPQGVTVSGGFSGDGYRFQEAPVVADVLATSNVISIIGFYGDRLKVMTSLRAGWQEFGVERRITKAEKNVLYEIDRQPVLPLFEKYLGDSFQEVPASSIQYPISLRSNDEREWLTRTIIGIDREAGSLVFAGDVPHRYKIRLMKTTLEDLVGSSAKAAVNVIQKAFYPDLAILVSCFGRRGVMGEDSYKELNAVQAAFGDKTISTGFYSYGEIGAFNETRQCKLHNQTMAITAFAER